MLEVNIIEAVSIQKKINDEINFLTKSIIEAPKDLIQELQSLIIPATPSTFSAAQLLVSSLSPQY